ncbi:D-alanyl-D-alanine carboxypeptidase, penicillin-binding protein 6a [Gammaproteobacteria bacterium]|nr:D-alanyl-D-alanine carboxypeptidase, penicillin-binding protein 6a [Gammaproteobacteria bacterium]
MEAKTGSILAQSNGYSLLEPASITKIMSSYIVAQAIEKQEIALTDKVIISNYARSQEGSRMFVEKNSAVSVLDLMRGMIIHSGNDSTVALSEHVAGTEAQFVVRMNAMAVQMGLKNTHFKNSTGLPANGHLTNAYDIALLSRHLIYDHPDIYKIYAEKTFTWNKITQPNRNQLLFTDPSVDGIKTGHTSAAGYCLVSSSVRDNFRLIAVVLGGAKEKDRYDASKALLDFGYREFIRQKIYTKEEIIANISLREGTANTLAVGLPEDLELTFKKGRYQDITAQVKYNIITAPVKKGTVVGDLIFTLDAKVLLSIPVVALQSVEKTNFVFVFLSRLKQRSIAKFNDLVILKK